MARNVKGGKPQKPSKTSVIAKGAKRKSAMKPSAKRRRSPAGWRSAKAIPVFHEMSGDEFSALILQLIGDDVRRVGLSAGALDSFVSGNKGDGGVDAHLMSPPPRPTDFLPTNKAVFQFKRSCPKSSSLFAELAKPEQARARRLLAEGADYILVTGADVRRDEVEPLLQAGLRTLIPSWGGRAEIWPAARVQAACFQNSATWRRVADGKLATNLLSWDDWSRSPRFDADEFRWTPDAARKQMLESFWAESTESKRHGWRFIGAPGVGKSRLVLEATRHLRASVIVAPSFSSDLAHLLRALRVGWLVVDECTDEQHEALIALAAETDTSIITIGRDTQPWASASNFRRVPTMSWEETVQLVPQTVTDPELRRSIARSAGGYPKLLRLYANAMAHGQASASKDDRDLDRALREFLRNEFKTNQQALQLWALPNIATTKEIEALASPLEVLNSEIDQARKFLLDEGLLGSVGDADTASHYVTPILFAEWLARSLWETSGPRVLAAVEGAPRSVRHECIRRLANGGSDLRKVLAGLDCVRLVHLLEPSAVGEVASALAPSNPEGTLGLVRRLLHRGANPIASGSVVWALRTLAWFPETFEESVELLVSSVGPSNDYILTDLFGTFMGVTRADGSMRLRALAALVKSAPHYAVRCALECCSEENSRGTGGLPGTLEEAWRPRSRNEEREYVRGAILELCRLLEAPGDPWGAQRAAAQAVRALFARVLGAEVAPLVDCFVRLKLRTTELFRAFELVEQFDLAQLGDLRAEQESLLRSYLRQLPPRTLGEQIDRLVDSTLWSERTAEDPPADANALANELVCAPDATEFLSALLKSESSPGLYEFGRLCARADTEHRLVPMLVSLAPLATRHQFAVGYFVEWPEADIDEKLVAWSKDESLGIFVFNLIHRLGGSDRRAQLLLDLVREGTVQPERLGDLYLGAWLRRVGASFACPVLDLTPLPSRLLMAEQWREGLAERTPVVIEAWHQVHGKDLHQMVDHVWGAVARLAREADLARFSASMIERLREVGEARASPHSMRGVLGEWLTAQPDAIAKILSATVDDQRLRWGIRELRLAPEGAAAAVEWARQHPEFAWLVAEFSSGFDELALSLLQALPGNHRAASALSAQAGSGSHWGSGVEFWTARAQALERLAERAKAASARRWFTAHAQHAQRKARYAHQEQQAFEQGIIPLPFVANSQR